MDGLTGFQRDLLYVIAPLDSPHGLTIKEGIEEYYHKQINRGQLYPGLEALIEKDLVKKKKIDDRTNCYQLTDQGIQKIKVRRKWENRYIEPE